MYRGTVYITGAGPGNPELLTLRAYRLIKQADAVVFDRLVSEEILSLAPPGAVRIYAGKSCKGHAMTQSEINATLLTLAKRKRCVVRLKGGDPFTFGRGGEEAEFLAAHGVAFEIVPGITAASGCGAYAGIPLTHRGLATGVRYVTGHRQEDGRLDLNWASLADPDCTLVFYMALGTAEIICRELIAAGLSPHTPAAAIQEGTSERQKRVLGTLATLPGHIEAQRLEAPVTLMIGRVVTLAETLNWFETDATNQLKTPPVPLSVL